MCLYKVDVYSLNFGLSPLPRFNMCRNEIVFITTLNEAIPPSVPITLTRIKFTDKSATPGFHHQMEVVYTRPLESL